MFAQSSRLLLISVSVLLGAAAVAVAQPDWAPKLVHPPARALAAMAYDAARGQLVLFGGEFPDGTYTNETWLFDGHIMTQANPAHSPSARSSPGMAFDPVRNQVVLVGGAVSSGSGASNDTWAWTGSDWQQLSPATSPPQMKSPVAAEDTARSRMVLFGNGQTWEWNGTNWTQIVTQNSPAARTGACMAYDAQRGYMVLMGGVMAGNTFPNDTWTYDGTNWTLVWVSGSSGDSGSAPGRFYAGSAYDAERRQVIIFGGGDYSGSSYYTFNDTWAWDGSKWNQLTPILYGSDATHPAYRLAPAMAYYPPWSATIMYGGQRGPLPGVGYGGQDDTWMWDGTVWTPLSPVNREGANMVWDSTRNHVVLFGGYVASWSYTTDSFDDQGTWIWDGAVWQVQNPAHKPQQRREFAMAYDAARDRVLIFGGATERAYASTSDLGDMWSWDGTDWTQLKPATLPPARHGARMVYDAANQRVILFGGAIGSTNQQDTWSWNGTNWTQLSPGTNPPALVDYGMAYDPAHSRVVIAARTYAGYIDATNNWTALTTPGGLASQGGQMVYDTDLGKMVLYDGNAVWTFDGTTWATLTTATTLPNRANTQIAYDNSRNQVVLYGGGTSSYPVGDTWVLTEAQTTGDIYVATNLAAASYVIQPGNLSGSGTAWHWSGMAAPVTYTVTFQPVAGYVTPPSQTFSLSPGGIIAFMSAYGVQPGTINATSNIPANFTITGPYQYSGAAPGYTQTNVAAGAYTIHWVPIAGDITPADQTLTLSSGGSVTFSGTYTVPGTPCSLQVTTNLAGASFAVIGPVSYFGSGMTYSQPLIPAGTYTITYNPVAGYITPPSQTTTVTIGTLAFTGTYAPGTPSANPGWVLKTPPAPWGRYYFSAVYDAARQQVLMFGGSRGADMNETWVYDGANWTHKHPCHSPAAQESAALAYDSVNQKVVLSGTAATNRETWTWDGTDWTELSPASSPEAAGDQPPAVYDAARQQTVLINNFCSETWIWDGTNWTKKSPATSLPGNAYCTAAYDAAQSQVVMLIFRQVYTPYSGFVWDTWTWDGINWTQKATGTNPTETYYAPALTYDPAHQQVVWFDSLGATWVWNGASWTQKSPANSPSVRAYAKMVLDPASSQVLLVGGVDVATYVVSSNGTYTTYGNNTQVELSNDVWIWDGNNWTQRSATPTYPVRVNNFFVYDDARGEVVQFSGSTPSGRSADTWIWNGSSWTQRDPANSPPPRFDYPIVYDKARQQVVIFGGNGSNVYLNDTWVWDGVNWTQKFPANPPIWRRGQMMAYDATNKVTVMFGGTTYDSTLTGSTVALNDTWIWDGTNWTQMHPATSPPAREQGAMIYDPVHSKVVLFGGGLAGNGTKFGDTWEWDGANWTQMNPASSPSPRAMASIAFDTLRGYTLLYGGSTTSGSYTFVQDTWIWDGTNWTQQNSADTPAASLPNLTYDAARGQIMAFGGWTASQHYFAEDVWVWDQPQPIVQTGGIDVITNLAAATFSLAGAATYNGSGTSWWQSAAPLGGYTITFNPVAGYTTPASQILTLAACCTLTFTGNYNLIPSTGTITVNSSLAAASFTVSGPASYTGSGLSWSQTNAPTGAYTVTFNDVAGYTTPAPQTLTLTGGGTIAFTGTYAGIPAITNVTPDTGQEGQQNLPVTITAQFTNFKTNQVTVDFGAGISVVSVTVNSPTSLTVLIDIADNATFGPRTVTVSYEDPHTITLPNGFFVVSNAPDGFQVRYAANLDKGESYIDIVNAGSNGAPLLGPNFGSTVGNLCVNVYAFSPDEEMIACCSCLITPGGVVSLGVKQDLLANTVSSAPPTSAVVALMATLAGGDGTGTSCSNSAAIVSDPASGMVAWGTTLHATQTVGVYQTAETPFLVATLSQSSQNQNDELHSLTGRCASIVGNASGNGTCASCRPGALAGSKK